MRTNGLSMLLGYREPPKKARVIGIGGALLTAWLAPAKPMKHAIILGCVGTVLGLVGLVATWNLQLGPILK